jgi:hypothetical protein
MLRKISEKISAKCSTEFLCVVSLVIRGCNSFIFKIFIKMIM